MLKWTQMHRTLEHEWCLSIDLANYPRGSKIFRFKYHKFFLKKLHYLNERKDFLSSRFVHRPRYEILEILQVFDWWFSELSSREDGSPGSATSGVPCSGSAGWVQGELKCSELINRTQVILMNFDFLFFHLKSISCQPNKYLYFKLLILHILTPTLKPMNTNENQYISF